MPAWEDYPPEEHLGRDLAVAYRLPEPGRIVLTAPVAKAVLRGDHSVYTEVVGAVVDEAVGFVAVLAALPDWGSTAALSLGFTNDGVDPSGVITVEGRVVKAGKRLIFVECLVACGDVLVAHAEGQFARVPRAGANREMDVPSPDPDELWEMGDGTNRLTVPFPQSLGMEPVTPNELAGTAAEVRLGFRGYVSNSAGMLHGGVAAALAVAPAEAASGSAATHATVQFLSPGREGPFIATATEFAGQRDGVWRTETIDSSDGRVMTRAVVTTSR